MSFTREKVLHHAQVEINETDGTIYGKWYKDVNNAPGFDAPGTPWCAMFASYVYSMAGDDRYPAFAYCPYWIKWLKENGYWKTSNPRPGDLVFFDWDGGESDHVAIVEKINSNGTIGVIEGNSAQGNVKRTDYNTNIIIGYSNTGAMYFGEVEQAPQEPVAPTPPAQAPTSKYQVGDHVEFGSCYRSSTSKLGWPPAGEALVPDIDHGVITRVYPGTNNPYLINDGMCFVNDGDIRESAPVVDKTYTVQSGDTLWDIAGATLGDPTRYKDIMDWNGLGSDVIHAGQVLIIKE